MAIRYSVVIPVYKNEENIPRLVEVLGRLASKVGPEMEVVFVVDGSPDQSYALLHSAIATVSFPAQLLAHSRNFGSFPAIRTGLSAARGEYFGVMAADLQEPPELMEQFFETLSADTCDIAIGTRAHRNDPLLSRLASTLFWSAYRSAIVPDMPKGGVDVFGCNRKFRDELLKLEESRSSLIALIFWLGFRRTLISYERQTRLEGKSAWTLKKKIDYFMDSVFAFTDYPIRLLMRLGAVGVLLSAVTGTAVIVARLSGAIDVPGYAATIITVLFFGTLNIFGLGLVGTYAWRAYENSKHRPLAILARHCQNDKGES
jgi:polyisoprenyl-phosphate glycosyltransferase